MISRPTSAVIEALSSLEHNRDFKEVISYLKQSRDASIQRCLSEHDTVTLRQLQGAATDLTKFIELAEDARNLMDKLR